MEYSVYPDAADPNLVGSYPALANAGGGFVWDKVLEYRVWCHPENHASHESEDVDYYNAFSSYSAAKVFSERTMGAEDPIALILQEEYIEEPVPGVYLHVRDKRITEWPVEFLLQPKRNPTTITNFMSPDAPENRVDVLRGLARPEGNT
jgi:hypothetical protein